MKKIRKIFKALVITSVMAATGTSCSDFLEEYSQDLAKVESWNDLDELLLGDAYFPPATLSDNNSNLDIIHFMGDEIVPNLDYTAVALGYASSYVDDMFPFYTWMSDTGINKLRDYVGGDAKYWNDLYKRINVCNMVIELIDEQPEHKSDDIIEKMRVKGEAHFLRAAFYYFLVNLYGKPYVPSTADSDLGVPVKLTGSIEDVEFSRCSLNETYAQILADLATAEECLSQTRRKSVYRADILAAYMLHSRVSLYMQDWENAAFYAEKVMAGDNSLLNLVSKTPGEDCIYANSPETIFSSGGYAIAAAFADFYSDFWDSEYEPTFFLSDDMVSLFADNDLRKERYVGNTEVLDLANAFRKVNGQQSKVASYCSVSSQLLFRLPEAYLNYAEAMAYMGKDSEACSKLNTFLKSRMLGADPVSLSGNALIDFIREERAREFLLEGHRWFDLRRYTVCEPYPWSKVIVHDFPFTGKYDISYVERYVLEKNDAAYTLPIPRAIRNFQVSIGNNQRPDRVPTKYVPEDDDDDDDWW